MHRRGHKSGLLLDVLCTVPSGSSLSVLTGHALRDKLNHYMYERRTFHSIGKNDNRKPSMYYYYSIYVPF